MSFEIIKSNINFDFVGKRKLAYTFSGILILLSLLETYHKLESVNH